MPQQHRLSTFGPNWLVSGSGTYSNSTGITLDASTEKIGFRYWPLTTSPIVAIDMRLNVTGTPGNFKTGVFASTGTYTADAPDDATQLGTYTANWTPSGTGWIGRKALASNTGNLTKLTQVWIVTEYVSGTIDGTNNIQAQHWGNGTNIQPLTPHGNSSRHHNGTNWTTTAGQTVVAMLVIEHEDGTYAGVPFTTTTLARPAAATDVFGSNVQGVRFKCGAQVKVTGFFYNIFKAGSPSDLVVEVYEGDTVKYSDTITAALIASSIPNIYTFTSPVLLAADTNLFLICSQSGAGGTDANDYDLSVYTLDTTYVSALVSSDRRFVYGTGAPSGLTVSTLVEVPILVPLIEDPATDYDMAAGGGFVPNVME